MSRIVASSTRLIVFAAVASSDGCAVIQDERRDGDGSVC